MRYERWASRTAIALFVLIVLGLGLFAFLTSPAWLPPIHWGRLDEDPGFGLFV